MKIKNSNERRINSRLRMLITEDQLKRLAKNIIVFQEQKFIRKKILINKMKTRSVIFAR